MKIGYLHIGPPEHGVCRYGKLLAAAARSHPSLTVIEAEVLLGADLRLNRQQLIEAAQQLSTADVIHFQFHKFNELSWGGGQAQLRHLKTFLDHCSRPLVVTLHNIFYPPYGLKSVIQYVSSKLSGVSHSVTREITDQQLSQQSLGNQVQASKRSLWVRGTQFLQGVWWGTFGPDALALQEISRRVDCMLVCAEEEARRLGDRVNGAKLQIIPHFVEARSTVLNRSEVRAALQLDQVKTITLLGFIYPTKGHRLVIEAMPELPEDIRVIFAGGPAPGYEDFVQDCLSLAQQLGVSDRLQITGYLPEELLERYLVATDLAICPFEMTSASGSLSTWISAARPILTSNIPQVAEYNRLEPEAIKTFAPYNSAAFAQAVIQQLQHAQVKDHPAVASLRQQLSMSNILEKHLIQYHKVAKVPVSMPIPQIV